MPIIILPVYAAITLPLSLFNGFSKLEMSGSSLNDKCFNKAK